MKAFFEKHREVILYLLFGAITTVVAFITYEAALLIGEHLFHVPMDDKTSLSYTVTYVLAQVLQWLTAVLTAFYTNRRWVFTEADHSKGSVWHQLWLFAGSRVATFFLDLGATYGFIHLLDLWINPDTAPAILGIKLDAELWAKVIVSILVVIANYVISKLLVFRKKAED